jgi:hypothetical protein
MVNPPISLDVPETMKGRRIKGINQFREADTEIILKCGT